jgi:hypothetical protein
MSLKTLMKYLQKPVADTPDTPEKIIRYQREASVYAGCTPDTPDTPRFGDTHENAQLGSAGEAVNDPSPPTAKPDPPAKLAYQEWVATWQPLAEAYHLHHFNCPICISAGKGYGMRCGAGASLWVAYSGAE